MVYVSTMKWWFHRMSIVREYTCTVTCEKCLYIRNVTHKYKNTKSNRIYSICKFNIHYLPFCLSMDVQNINTDKHSFHTVWSTCLPWQARLVSAHFWLNSNRCLGQSIWRMARSHSPFVIRKLDFNNMAHSREPLD